MADSGRNTSGEKVVSLQDALKALGFGRFQWIIYFVGGLSQFADGMEMLVVSFLYIPLNGEWGLKEEDIGFVASAVFVGFAAGSLILGPLADKIGRRNTTMLSLFLVFFFGLISAFCPEYWTFVVCRGFVGFGLGGVGPAVWSLISEFFPADSRGIFLVLLSQMWAVGEMLECGIAAVVLGDKPQDGWREFLAWSAVPALIGTIVVYFWMPESPRYLSIRGQQDELQKTLRDAARQNGTLDELNRLLTPGTTITCQVVEQRGSFTDLVRPGILAMTLCVWCIWFVQSFVFYGLTFTLPAIMRRLSAKDEVNDNIYEAAFWASLVELPGAFLTAFLTDWKAVPWFGRRHLLSLNMVIVGVFAFLVVFIAGHNASLVLIFVLFMKAFINGSFSLTWAYTSELYPTADRSTSLGAASAWSRAGGMITPVLSGWLLRRTLGGPFVVWGVAGILGAVAAHMLGHDTAGEELEDTMEEHEQHERESKMEKEPLMAEHI